ncbi:MAG: hypothetical protein ABR556_03415 [Pyrinomonadaceae bacterium]
MVNASGRKDDTQSINDKERLEERKSDATSHETLSDLEETGDSSSTDNGLDPGPSPDGMLDESDEIKDAGPM